MRTLPCCVSRARLHCSLMIKPQSAPTQCCCFPFPQSRRKRSVLPGEKGRERSKWTLKKEREIIHLSALSCKEREKRSKKTLLSVSEQSNRPALKKKTDEWWRGWEGKVKVKIESLCLFVSWTVCSSAFQSCGYTHTQTYLWLWLFYDLSDTYSGFKCEGKARESGFKVGLSLFIVLSLQE